MKDKAQTHLTSLEKAWGSVKQENWQIKKKELTLMAVEYYHSTPTPSFFELYKFIADGRRKIAIELNQPSAGIGILRKKNDDLFDTPISGMISGETTRYSSFFEDLEQRYAKMTQAIPPKPRETLAIVYNLKNLKSINAVEEIQIKYKGISYSSLHRIHATDSQNNEIVYFKIFHTSPKSFAHINTRLAELYFDLNEASLSKDQKCNIIKEICWHLSHAMHCKRGGAAIMEIMIDTLLEGNEITFTTKPNIPLDLLAIFSESPGEFDKIVTFNAEIEKTEELTVQDLKDRIGKNQLRFFTPVLESDATGLSEDKVAYIEKD